MKEWKPLSLKIFLPVIKNVVPVIRSWNDGAQVELKLGAAMESVKDDWQEEQSNYSSCQEI